MIKLKWIILCLKLLMKEMIIKKKMKIQKLKLKN